MATFSTPSSTSLGVRALSGAAAIGAEASGAGTDAEPPLEQAARDRVMVRASASVSKVLPFIGIKLPSILCFPEKQKTP